MLSVNELESLERRSSKCEIQEELMRLPKEAFLLSFGSYSVYCVIANHIPCLLKEIGYLRSLAFSEFKSFDKDQLDLDTYDQEYLHLFVWNELNKDVVGAYRLGLTDRLSNDNFQQLYSSSQFKISHQFFNELGCAIELSRSFVSPNYQKTHAPLFLLFKGIGKFIARHPRYRYLFGLISINHRYSLKSQYAIYAYLKNHLGHTPLAKYVSSPNFPKQFLAVDDWAAAELTSLDQLDEYIKKNEVGLKSAPALLKAYLKFSVQLINCSVDPHFGHCLDLFCLTDLVNTDRNVLERYMDKDIDMFLAFHKKNKEQA